MTSFSRLQLEAARGRRVPDLVPPGVRLLFVGINPGLWTAAAQAHFARPGNRFYDALYAGGVIDRRLDVRHGFGARSRSALLDRGIGITNLVNRATARADELETLGDAGLWALPNPSGLNAHYQIADLARLYRAAARAAGLELLPRPGHPSGRRP